MPPMNKLYLLVLFWLFVASCDEWHPGGNQLFPVRSGESYGYINRSGKVVIPFRYYRAGCFDGGVAVVSANGTNHRRGYIDKDGKYVIAPVYSYATSFSEGLAFVVHSGGVPQAIDKNGVAKFSLPDAQSAENFSDGLAAFSLLGPTGEIWGFVSKQGNQVIAPHFRAVSYFSEGWCGVMNHMGTWGYINKSGEVAIDYIYENVQPFSGGKAKVAIHGKWGVIDKNNRFVLNPEFTDLDVDGERYLVRRKDKWGWVDKDGLEVIPYLFTDAYPFKGNNLAAVKSGEKWGYINTKGKFIIAPQYDFAFGFDDGMALVEVNGKYGFIDEQGKFVIHPDFDHVPVDYYIRYFARTSAFYSVKTDINKPKTVAYKWLTGFYHMDYDEARRYATEDTRGLLDQFNTISDMISDSSRLRMQSLIIGIRDCKENGNRAIVTYTLSDNKNKEQLLFLVRTGGRWLVQFSKNQEEPQQEDVLEEPGAEG